MKVWNLEKLGRAGLVQRQASVPEPKAGEVLVKVGAVSLNYRDKLVIETGMGLDLPQPFVPASDMAGRVVKLGAGVTRFKVGDRVIGHFMPDWIEGKRPGQADVPPYQTLGGAYQGVLAEYVSFPADWFSASPKSLDDAEASTLPIAALTAWFALVEYGGLKAGDSVLVQGTGGVALFGLQLAKSLGAEVFVTSASDEKLARAKALGADHLVNRRAKDWVEEVYRLTDGKGVDHILEIAGGAHLGKSLQAVAVGGIISMIGVLEGFEIAGPAAPLLLKSPRIQGVSVGHRRGLEDLSRAVDATRLKPVIGRRFAFDSLPAALDHLDEGPFGKIVIDLSQGA
jgi:NADPH:quinone reductase-like Zn-dependent oxidoreductase